MRRPENTEMIMFSARTWFLVAAMLATCYPGLTAATTYTVGGDGVGWGIPADTSYYQKWAANKTFVVGDILNFNWTSIHDVANVNEADYKACTKVNSVVGDKSPVRIELNTSGDQYYICTVDSHCSFGQKLFITIEASTTNTTSPAATSPSATSSPSSASSMSLNFLSVHVLSVAYYGAILLVLFV